VFLFFLELEEEMMKAWEFEQRLGQALPGDSIAAGFSRNGNWQKLAEHIANNCQDQELLAMARSFAKKAAAELED